MALNIALADYGVGNLHSIRKALELCGARPRVTTDMSSLLEAECIVLPGVGAFSRTMERLLPHREGIVRRLEEGVPCLGICIGAHILFEGSEEGTSPGLSFLKGRVVRLATEKVPHMGWNMVESQDPIFQGIDSRYFYFAHSFHGLPEEEVVIGETEYQVRFPSIFRKGNVIGTQFHPEKSSESGLRFLKNFVEFAEGRA
ncbi:MAG: imidazole glycerol phosphate synthase subunit HisH [Methanomassiliicoccales archaeon]